MESPLRLSTGIDGLDERLGGGLIPGTLTLVVGPTGVGKTQFGLHFSNAGAAQEGQRGILLDTSARIDSQGHDAYARRMFDWQIRSQPLAPFTPDDYFSASRNLGDALYVFGSQRQRVTQRDVGFDVWHDWQVELAAKLEVVIDFLYGNFVRGARRAVFDGFEPADKPSESIQYELFEYIYHQVLRKESAWVARDLFRQDYRANAEAIESHAYDCQQIGGMLLATSHEAMLETLIERPLVDGDLLATANTLIYLGKIRTGNTLSRGLYIAKHRGSACSNEILSYSIDDQGLHLA